MNAPDITGWLEREPYSMAAADKSPAFAQALDELTEWHRAHCPPYARILQLFGNREAPSSPEQVPFIPVRLFKEFDLASVDQGRIFKTMTSSGTTGQQVSRIHLDRETASLQAKVLARLMATVLGKKRLPMLVIDSPSVVGDRQAFSARGAGILGFSLFGQDLTYALDDAMQLDVPAVRAFLERHAGKSIFVFGFTSIIWQHFYLPLKAHGMRLPLDEGILVHGGGWKKMQDQAVGAQEFRAAMAECTGIQRVHNYYGMVEQTGSIHLECEHGHLHAPVCADVIVRDPVDFHPLPKGRTGLVEVLSLLPRSYPGHALLTEDVGRIEGEDDCACGRLGKYFSIAGRVARAEVRGCSDTYEKRS